LTDFLNEKQAANIDRVAICEREDRWTKLLRRSLSQGFSQGFSKDLPSTAKRSFSSVSGAPAKCPQIEVVRYPSLAMVEEATVSEIRKVFFVICANSFCRTRVETERLLGILLKNQENWRGHRFVIVSTPKGQALPTPSEIFLKAGASACFFSLFNVESVADAVKLHFANSK